MKNTYLLLITGLLGITLFFSTLSFANANSASYTAAPPFVATNIGKPNVVIALDISGSMKLPAYSDTGINWRRGTHNDFDPNYSYYGYFESNQKYSYSTDSRKQFFYADANGAWDGNYLNWLTMRRMDAVRKVLVGGKIQNRDGTLIDGKAWYILEGQNEPLDYTFKKKYSNSASLSPIANNAEVLISEGSFSATSGEGVSIVQVNENVEIGTVTIDRNRDDHSGFLVEFKNTYDIIPSVVATGLSYNGGQPALPRVFDVTQTSFRIQIDEWEYLDGNHTTETISFIVARPGVHNINIRDTINGSARTIKLSAGKQLVSDFIYQGNGFSTSTLPRIYTNIPPNNVALFTGISSKNNSTPITARVEVESTLTNFSFRVGMQREDRLYSYYFDAIHPPEIVSWVAIESAYGFLDHPLSGHSPIEIGVKNNHNSAWKKVNLQAGLFSKPPIVGVSMQSFNDEDTAVVRYGNSDITKDAFDVLVEEEKSEQSEITHQNETIGYFAIEHNDSYKIRIGINTEPTGIIQQNAGSVRFGMAVYNYDHSREPTSIYNGNSVNGGTFRACYPDASKRVSERTNFDICLDTHVKSPLSNIINVIEDHPLIWGTTPIAETLYDIKGYFSQTNFNRGKGNHTQWYDNGTEYTAGQRNSYEINNDWDPYYYPEYQARLPCAKSFVLHFNDGAPFKDFDGNDNPFVKNDGIGNFGPQQMLDDLALELRKEDCRTDSSMAGHQDIISYYVYSALGEGEQFNDDIRRMREAAANGGFVDHNGDNLPTPAHPADFNSYIKNSNCTPNEWDENGDCNPDTFYFANDAEELVTQLNAALESITARSGSGGAASVIAASRSGEGAVFNAIFRPSVTSGGQEVTWIGDVHALMIDSSGNLRQDNGDGILGSPAVDKYIDMCSYDDGELREVRIKLSTTLNTRPSRTQSQECAKAVFDKDLFDLEYLWSASNWLSSLSDSQATTQRTYTDTTLGRYILSGIDTNNDGLITNTEVVEFIPDNFDEATAGLLAGTLDDAQNVVDYIRGQDLEDYRSRQLNGKTMRLGDVIYSTPTVVGRPAENLDLIYGSTSYQTFFNHYRYRRQMVYAGGNDGMLHAFNSGWFDPATKQFKKAKGSGAPGSSIPFDLGAELWAYAPYNTLGHLEYLTRPSYGAVSSDHLYFVDLEPRIFDAKIFANDTDHPGGWGTVLVVGSRLGGGVKTVDMDLSANVANRTLRSSIAIFDITNPDRPPRLLLEFTDPQLGFTTAIPAPIVTGNDAEGNGGWYLLLGSGADTNAEGFNEVKSTQKATLFLLDLKAIAASSTQVLATAFGGGDGKVQLPDENSFISDLSAVDFGLDNFTTDAVYFGTVSGDKNNWGGKIYRILIQENNNEPQKVLSHWEISEVFNPNRPITAPVSMGTDNLRNRWLHVGTGRFFTQEDNLDNSNNYFYGLKEARSALGIFTYSTLTKIMDVTDTRVRSDNAKIEQPPLLSPPLSSEATIHNLQTRMKTFGSTESVDGWVRTLSQGEKNFGAATLFGGTLTFTTFDPEFNECSIDGDARLYVLNALTGTAGSPGILAQDNGSTYNEFVIDLGSSPATSPSIHIGDGYSSDNKANAVIQTSDGAITTVEQKNQENIRSGEISWRELLQ